jgi:cysteinyl-tRNA synthetase
VADPSQIIIKARRQRLLDLEKKKQYTEDQISELGRAAFQSYAKNNLPLLINEAEAELDTNNYIPRRDAAYGKVLAGGTLSGEGKPGDDEAKLKMHISNMTAAVIAINGNQVFKGADEILLPYLDSLYKETIDTSDQTIFTDLTRFMEGEFTDDMNALNVLEPDVVVRVTDYVPQIAEFVERVVEKGFAYEAEGSVYFDIAAFEKGGNTYARLRPESRNDKSLQEEGEGSLSKSLGGKRGAGDFALWKKSKAGEPWDRKWISIPVALISLSPTMIMNSPRAKLSTANMATSTPGSTTSCTWGIFLFQDPRCPSPSKTFRLSKMPCAQPIRLGP